MTHPLKVNEVQELVKSYSYTMLHLISREQNTHWNTHNLVHFERKVAWQAQMARWGPFSPYNLFPPGNVDYLQNEQISLKLGFKC